MRKTVLFALIFAVLAAFCAYIYLSDLEIKYKTMSEPVKTVIAAQRITQGTVIQSYMLTEKFVPKEYVQPKAFQNIKELFIGEGTAVYISLNTIEENEQILSTKISKTNQDIGISNLIPEGKKALSINFDLETSSVLAPGTSIDIFSVIDYSDANKELQKSVFVVAQNVLVLAVGNNYIGVAKKQEDDSGNVNVITLAVSIEEAQKILIASESGSLKYIIRPVSDVEISDIQPLKLSSIVKDISKITLQQNGMKNLNQVTQNQKDVLEIISRYSQRK
ncbi:MAG: Flp pilus assembly protein CpaB [Endomicrobium sp.]|jgi:pilus assembly protein CpaB|nr:Flp pilus assembly protein CpaB [Endomicrobium sp.]